MRDEAALVEFALTAPLLLLLMAGVLNYGIALRTAVAVSDAARAGAQYGSMSAGQCERYRRHAGGRAQRRADPDRHDGDRGSILQVRERLRGELHGNLQHGFDADVRPSDHVRHSAELRSATPGCPLRGAVSAKAVMRAQ